MGEIRGLQQRTLSARILRFLGLLVLLGALAAGGRVGLLYKQDQGARPPLEYVKDVKAEARELVQVSRHHLSKMGAQACRAAFSAEMVPASDLRHCLGAESSTSSLRSCVEMLAESSR